MSDFVFPTSDLDRREVLLSIMGSHWAQTYQGVDLVASYLYARAQLEKQSFNDSQESAASLATDTVPVLHRQRWYRLTLRESDLNGPVTSLLHYGEGATYGYQESDGRLYKYGEPFSRGDFAFPLPEGLVVAPIMFNRISDPSLTMIDGIDFITDREYGALRFRTNPFLNPLVGIREVFTGSDVTDRECAFWVCHAQIDNQDIYNYWGYVLGILAESSENYRELVDAHFDALMSGTAKTHIDRVLAAVADVPLTLSDDETVEVIATDREHKLVITDKHAYKFQLTATPVVSVGDVVSTGDPLVDAVQVFEFNRGQVPDEVLALTMGKGFLAAGYLDGITFQNKVVPLEVTTDAAGYTRVEFEVGGFPTDVEKFWDDTHAAGISTGQTLANLLDVRRPVTTTIAACDTTVVLSEPSGQPGAASLPATINPLGFLIQNVLRNNAFVVKIKVQDLGPASLGLSQLRTLRKLIPPHTAMLIIEELTLSEGPVILDGPPTDSEPGYEESASLGLGAAVSDTPDMSYIQDGCVTLRHVSGSCL